MSTADVYGLRGYTGTAGTPGNLNPLVVGSIDTTHALSGTRLVEDICQISEAIENKDWLSGTLAGVATVADFAAAVVDPIGTAFAMGIGWVLDHVEPLKGWMNDLTGDAGAVAGAAATWGNISIVLQQAADDAQQLLDTYFARQRSAAIHAFWSLQSSYAEHIGAAAGLAGALSTGLTIASTLVQIVHDLVRDAIADVVGKIASSVILEVVTLGLATPWVVSNIATMVAKWSARLSSEVKALISSFDELSASVRKADEALTSLKTLLSKLGDVPTSVKNAISDSAIGRGATQFREGVTNVRQGADELVDIAKKWWKPEFSDDIVRQTPSATDRIEELLHSKDVRKLFEMEGVGIWDPNTYRMKRNIRADSPFLSDFDRRVLYEMREAFGPIKNGDIIAKAHLRQAGFDLPKAYADLQGFVAKAADTVGQGAAQRFDSLGGGYYLDDFVPGTLEHPRQNTYNPNLPLFETRVRADEDFAARSRIPYGHEMNTGPGFRGGSTVDIRMQNGNHPNGPFTGTGVTYSTGETIVPENVYNPPEKTSRVRYQEIYEIGHDGTATRRAIVADLPWRPGKPVVIRTFR